MSLVTKTGGANWGAQAPIYVTRKNADGWIGSYSMSLGMSLPAMLLVWLNVIAWGLIGLYEAVRVFV